MKHNYLLHFSLLLAIWLLPDVAWGETNESVTLKINQGKIIITSTGYKQGDNDAETAFAGKYVITQDDSGTKTENNITVESGTHTITLSGVNIEPARSDDGIVAFGIAPNSTVNLMLQGTNKLIGGMDEFYWGTSAIHVPENATLIIDSNEEGAKLDARVTSQPFGAAIGSNDSEYGHCGQIEIRGGHVSATGGGSVAGIGRGFSVDDKAGTIIISGGWVETTKIISTSAEISGGTVKVSSNIESAVTISDGTVETPEIKGKSATINGGTVKVSSNINSAVTISNGTVETSEIKGTSTEISGGTVKVSSNINSAVTISNGTVETPEIKGTSATISGGTVKAKITSTTFSTGESGSAMIIGHIYDRSNIGSWSCINTDDGNTIVRGTQTLYNNLEVAQGKTLIVIDGASLTLGEGGSLTNNGVIYYTGTAPTGISGTVIKLDNMTTNKLFIGNGTKGTDYTVENKDGVETVTIQTETPLTFVTLEPLLNSFIVVESGVHADITLGNCFLGKKDYNYTYKSLNAPIDLQGSASATVHFYGTNELYGYHGHAGIEVPADASVTINGEGSLVAWGGLFAAGIGGGNQAKAGIIRIESGIIQATGGATGGGSCGGAGIGGGGNDIKKTNGYSHSIIIITGGDITARGGYKSTGIGAGLGISADEGSEIRIEGGYVKATPGDNGKAGIGAQYNCRNIIISGGTIETSSIGNGDPKETYPDNGTLKITGGSVKYWSDSPLLPDVSKYPYLLTLDGVGETLNSVSVDGTPYYIDQPHTTNENRNGVPMYYKGHLYLYIPKKANKVYLREGEAVVPYTINWPTAEGSTDMPTATRGNASTPKPGNLSCETTGYSYAHGSSDAFVINIAETGTQGTSSGDNAKAIPMNVLLVTLTPEMNGGAVYEKRIPASLNNEGKIVSNITSELEDVPVGEYTMTLQYGGDATYKPTALVTTTLKIEKGTLRPSDFTVTLPTDLIYDGKAKEATVTCSKTGIGEVTLAYYKGDKKQGQPVDAGKYDVKLTVTGNDIYNAVTEGMGHEDWTFTIAQKDLTVTPDKDQVFFNEGKDAKITYTHSGFADTDKNDDDKVAFAGALVLTKQDDDSYLITNPVQDQGGLLLTGSSKGNYKLLFTDQVPATVYEGDEASVKAILPDGFSENTNGWVKPDNYSFSLKAPAGFTFTDADGNNSSTEKEITADGEHTYYLKHNDVNEHVLYTDATAPTIPVAPDAGSLTTTTAVFILSDETSGIATYQVLEGEEVIAAYSEVRAAATAGQPTLSYTYTGKPGSTHTLTFEVTDMAGNTNTADVTFALKSNPPYIPPTPPVEEPTGLEEVRKGAPVIRTLDSRICITTAQPLDMRILGIDGRVVRLEKLPAGYSEVSGLQKGVYIVILSDGSREKVMVR